MGVERRRLALKKNVTVTNSPDSDFNLTYDLTDKDADIPKWFKDDPKAVMNTSKQIHIFGGSNPIKNETWTAHAGRCSNGDKCTKKSKYLKDSSYNKSTKACECGEAWVTKWYISTDRSKENVIFFDLVQKKWHMGGKKGLMYRNPSTNPEEVPSGSDDDFFCNNCYFQRKKTVKIPVCECRAGVCSNNKLHKTEAECNKEPGNKEPGCTWATKWIQFQCFSKAGRLDKNHPKGPKPHFAEGKKDATKPIRVS